MRKNCLIFLPVFFLLVSFSSAQVDNSAFLNDRRIPAENSGKLYFRFENVDFLKNNEYFNRYTVGYTLLGYMAKPKLVYFPSPNTKVEAGAYFLKYSGLENFTKVQPLFTFQLNYQDWFSLVMGSIYGSLEHRLIEPLYQFDRFYEDNPENGTQLLFKLKHFRADVWVAWEKFIFRNDPYKEQIFGGISGAIIPFDTSKKLSIEIPFQGIVKHYGGQIDISPLDMSSRINTAAGIDLNYKTGRFLKSVGWDGYFVTFHDLSPVKHLPYIDGFGFLTDLKFQTRYGTLYSGYWNCRDFFSPKGEPLFQSVSQLDSFYHTDKRELLTIRLDIGPKISRDVTLKLRLEGYYDLLNKNLDYSYGLAVIFNSAWFLKKTD